MLVNAFFLLKVLLDASAEPKSRRTLAILLLVVCCVGVGVVVGCLFFFFRAVVSQSRIIVPTIVDVDFTDYELVVGTSQKIRQLCDHSQRRIVETCSVTTFVKCCWKSSASLRGQE